MDKDNFKQHWGYSPVSETSGQPAAAGDGAPAAEPPEPPQKESRFNARKHNYTGTHICATPAEEAEYLEIH
jgi:hypothetical protein